MGMKDNLEKMQVRQAYRNLWHTDLMGTMSADPSYCCFACFCPCCASYSLRKRALYNDMSRYKCCAGYMPCSGRFGENRCPELCLLFEVWCCFSSSVSSTRFLIQDEFNIQTTPCDNCIIGFMFCLNQISCIFSIVACLTGSEEIHDIAEVLSCVAESVYCSVCACMQTQHKLELNKRDGNFNQQLMSIPAAQQMSRLDQPVPASAGYPHQGAMGYQPPLMAYPHQPPGYMPPPAAYGHLSPTRGHDPYAPLTYPPPHMYPPHGTYPGPGSYPPGPSSPGAYPPGPQAAGSFIPGPESGPYPPARPPPPPPGYSKEFPTAPLPPHQEHPEKLSS